MPDWERLVAERLAASKLPPEVQRDVVTEIAAHLEDCYRDFVRMGSADAEERALAQVSNWSDLCRNIRRTKEDAMSVVRKVLMPGVAAVIAAVASLKVFVYLLITPVICGPDRFAHAVAPGLHLDATCIIVSADGPAYPPWLLTLPLAGMLAAALSRWMGARPAQRLMAAVFPALYFFLEMFVMGLSGGFFWRIPVYWVAVPAIACAIGAVPFLGGWNEPMTRRPLRPTVS